MKRQVVEVLALFGLGLFDARAPPFQGRPIDPNNELIIKNVRGSEAMQLAWHPLLPLLAIGWKDGAISFWNAEEKHLEEDSKTHRSPVSSMTWNSTGDRLFTTDENAKLSVWKTDRLMRPIHIVSFDEQPGCRIHLCVLGPTETNPETGAVSTTVFYGVNQNNITVLKWANDLAYSGLVLELSDEAEALIYYPEKEQLLVTTGLCSMHLLAKDDALGTWHTISKMKFATGTGESATTLQVRSRTLNPQPYPPHPAPPSLIINMILSLLGLLGLRPHPRVSLREGQRGANVQL